MQDRAGARHAGVFQTIEGSPLNLADFGCRDAAHDLHLYCFIGQHGQLPLIVLPGRVG
jgi:hypothetical protein